MTKSRNLPKMTKSGISLKMTEFREPKKWQSPEIAKNDKVQKATENDKVRDFSTFQWCHLHLYVPTQGAALQRRFSLLLYEQTQGAARQHLCQFAPLWADSGRGPSLSRNHRYYGSESSRVRDSHKFGTSMCRLRARPVNVDFSQNF